MTIQTLNTRQDPYRNQPDYYRGRADAYDDSKTHTTDQLTIRAGMYADYHPSLAYAIGYMDRVIEFRLEQDAVAAAESELAQTNHARKQGRETSTLHQHNRRQRAS